MEASHHFPPSSSPPSSSQRVCEQSWLPLAQATEGETWHSASSCCPPLASCSRLRGGCSPALEGGQTRGSGGGRKQLESLQGPKREGARERRQPYLLPLLHWARGGLHAASAAFQNATTSSKGRNIWEPKHKPHSRTPALHRRVKPNGCPCLPLPHTPASKGRLPSFPGHPP